MKQPYTTPTVFRIKLDYQQAVLAACHTSATNRRAGAGAYCRTTCRRATASASSNTGPSS
jgi:hypothetical protein